MLKIFYLDLELKKRPKTNPLCKWFLRRNCHYLTFINLIKATNRLLLWFFSVILYSICVCICSCSSLVIFCITIFVIFLTFVFFLKNASASLPYCLLGIDSYYSHNFIRYQNLLCYVFISPCNCFFFLLFSQEFLWAEVGVIPGTSTLLHHHSSILPHSPIF